ncbi:MAG: POTRA domain-containing protein [Terracidiphilus sp.]
MIRQARPITAVLLLCSLPLLAQKKAPPRAIRFQGAPQYSQEELLTASGLKPGARLNANDVKAHAKQLNDTGFFAVVRFSNDSKGLLFTLTPASQLFPLHLDNLPLKPGKDLDDKLHAGFPLYHGLLPAAGSTVEGIRQTFEEMLAGEGVKATVKAALTSGLGPKKVTAMNFTIASPPVHIGPIQLASVSPAMQAKVNTLVEGQTGNEFDTENTAIGLKRSFEDLYQDLGYAAVDVDVAQIDPPIVSGQSSDLAIEIPFSVTVREGGVYKLGTISYPADALASRAEVEKLLSKDQAGSGRPLDLFLLAVHDAYHARGYLDCSVVSHASFSEATHIVNYNVEIDPGPLYKMGAVQFDGAPAPMAAKLTRLWKMAHGDTFDESYVSGFAAHAEKQDHTLSKWMQSVVTTFDVKADPNTHQVNCIFHFAKAAQGGR